MLLRIAPIVIAFGAATAAHAAAPAAPGPQTSQRAAGYYENMTPLKVKPPAKTTGGAANPASSVGLANETEEHEHGHGGDDKGGGKKLPATPAGIAPEPFNPANQGAPASQSPG